MRPQLIYIEVDVAMESVTEPQIRVGMVTRDRRDINLIIEHKVSEFKALIEKSVVAILNAQEELSQLSDLRNARSDLLTRRYKQHKAQLSGVADGLKEATKSAPMGIGNAAQLTLGASQAVGDSLLDASELQRKIADNAEEMYAAQMRYYIDSSDFETIAQRVADILAYRYQFLIFRLAGAEEGYIKLAHFFVASMKSYAIACLREQKHNIVKALVHAAIPPITDTLKYRNWSIFGALKLKTLKLDEESTALLQRCGPAVRTLLGGFEVYFDSTTGKSYAYQAFTIFGALNRAAILSTDKTIMAGLASPRIKYITLDGNVKYPMILLAANEKTADLGLKFGTSILTKERLDLPHLDALNRLVPNFFLTQADYSIHKISTQAGIEYTKPAALRYAEEKKEYPWTPERQKMLLERTKTILMAEMNHDGRDQDEDEYTQQTRGQLNAANRYDLELKRKEANHMKQEAYHLLQEVFAERLDTDARKEKQLEVVNHAQYVAFAAHQLLDCMSRFDRYEEQDLLLVKEIIETANLAIQTSRAHPIHETTAYRNALSSLDALEKNAEPLFKFQDLCEKIFEIVLLVLAYSRTDLKKDRFIIREELAQKKEKQSLISQMTKMMNEFQSIALMSRAIAIYHEDKLVASTPVVEVLQSFQTEMDQVRQSIVRLDERGHKKDLVELIRICKEEVTLYVKHLLLMLEDSHVTIRNRSNAAVAQEDPKEAIKIRINAYSQQVEQTFQEAQTLQASSRWLSNTTLRRNRLIALKTIAVEARDACVVMIKDLVYGVETAQMSPQDQKAASFFQRASISTEFGMLQYVASLRSKTKNIQLNDLYHQLRRLHAAYVAGHASQAEAASKDMQKIQIATLQSSLRYELREQFRDIRKKMNDLKLNIRDDMELVGLIYDHALVTSREVDHAQQALDGLKERLRFLKENHVTMAADESDVAIRVSSSPSFSYAQYIKEKLNEMLDNVVNVYPEEKTPINIREVLYGKLENLQERLSSNRPEAYVLGESLIIEAMQTIIHTYCSVVYASDLVLHINQHKKNIADLMNGDSLEYQTALEKAMRELKLVYRLMADVVMQKDHGIRAKMLHAASFGHSVPGTLFWAGTLSVTEKRWLDRKDAAETKTRLSLLADYKSPLRMFLSLIQVVVTDRIDKKQKGLWDLIHCKNKLIRMKSQLYLSDAAATDAPLVETPQQLARKRWLEKVAECIVTVESEVNDLRQLQRSLVQQSINIFFTEWKVKTQKSDLHAYLNDMKNDFSARVTKLYTEKDFHEKPTVEDDVEDVLSVVENQIKVLTEGFNRNNRGSSMSSTLSTNNFV